MKNKIIIILIIIVLLTVSVSVIFVIKNNSITDFSNIAVNDIVLTENSFEAMAIHLSSGSSFRQYKYEIEDETLYITISSGLVNKKYSSGDIRIKIEDDLSNVKSVYLKDKNNTKLIFLND